MIKKKAVLIALFSILALSFAIAQSNSSNNTITPPPTNSDAVSKAYACLNNQIDSKSQSALSLQEAIFGTLALGSNSKLSSVIEAKKSGDHWQESSSQIKDTAQVLLAYTRSSGNKAPVESWLLSKSVAAADLTWYLQVDIPNRVQSSCTLSYQGESQKTITVREDMTLSGNAGSCLSIQSPGFWLKVNNNCIDKNFTVSCDQDFISSLLYQRTSSQTIFVSPTTHSASALGQTTEKINSKCFSTSNSCDYEGSLWAALALDTAGREVSMYLPYLLALSENNVKYFPPAFLHKITSGSDQYSQVVQAQQQSKYWQAPNTPYNRYYDSALAMLSLQGTSAAELSNSQGYFLSIPTPEGCWNNNNIRDTGFLLYAGWTRSVGGGGTGGNSNQLCDTAGYTCTSLFTCNDLGGTALDYTCATGVCCSESPEQQSCSVLEGEICSSSELCSGTSQSSSDGSCCLGTCNPAPQANACEQAGGSCYASCNSDETLTGDSCDADSSDVCCKKEGTAPSGTSIWVWIILLVILIALVVLAIFYRHKLQMLWFKLRRKPAPGTTAQRGFPPGGRPPFPPASGPIPLRGQQPRFIPSQQGQQRPPIRRPGMSQADKDMEETMRKLKDMSK